MEEDEDDLYGAEPSDNIPAHQKSAIKAEDAEQEEGEELEDDDSDSDIDIITERKPGAKAEPTPLPSTRAETLKTETSRPSAGDRIPSTRSQAVSIKPDPSATTTRPPTTSHPPQAQPTTAASTTATSSRPGHTYPSISISSLTPNAPIPLFAPLNKPLTDLDFDADLLQADKAWRRPGADQSDWFNYGFDEFTWATYCLRQKGMRSEVEGQKAEHQRMEMMFGGGGKDATQAGGMGAMGAMGGGMPDGMDPNMMQGMMQQMMAQGIQDPSQMDFGAFMQQMQGPGMNMGGQGMGMVAPQGPQGHGGYGDGGYGRGRGRGRGGRW